MRYPSLEGELRVGEVYLRLLLDGAPKTLQIHAPGRFFNELYYRLLWERRRDIRLLCLQARVPEPPSALSELLCAHAPPRKKSRVLRSVAALRWRPMAVRWPSDGRPMAP